MFPFFFEPSSTIQIQLIVKKTARVKLLTLVFCLLSLFIKKCYVLAISIAYVLLYKTIYVLEIPPVRQVYNPFAIERPHATLSMLERQGSFRGFSQLSQASPFKRQLSLRVNDLPSTLERTRSHSLEPTDLARMPSAHSHVSSKAPGEFMTSKCHFHFIYFLN